MKKDRNIRILIIITILAVTLPTGLLIGKITFSNNINLLMTYLMLVLSIAAAVVLETAIHEAGHMLFGLLTGFRFLSYRVLSLIVTYRDGKLSFGRYSIPGTLGQCLMGSPVSREKKPYFLYNAGGLIANLISAVIFYLIAFRSDSVSVAVFFAVSGMYALIMFFSNGIPYKGSGVANDAENIREMHQHPEAIDSFYLMLDINEMLAEGKRTSDIPDEMLDLREATLNSGSLGASNILWLESRLMDQQKFDEAEKMIREIRDKDYPLMDLQRNGLELDQKYIDCLSGTFEDVTDKKLLKLIQASKSSSLSTIRYLYARALYLKNEKEANELLGKFASLEKGYPYKGEYQGEKELMDTAKEKISGTLPS